MPAKKKKTHYQTLQTSRQGYTTTEFSQLKCVCNILSLIVHTGISIYIYTEFILIISQSGSFCAWAGRSCGDCLSVSLSHSFEDNISGMPSEHKLEVIRIWSLKVKPFWPHKHMLDHMLPKLHMWRFVSFHCDLWFTCKWICTKLRLSCALISH